MTVPQEFPGEFSSRLRPLGGFMNRVVHDLLSIGLLVAGLLVMTGSLLFVLVQLLEGYH